MDNIKLNCINEDVFEVYTEYDKLIGCINYNHETGCYDGTNFKNAKNRNEAIKLLIDNN